jgi:hypothetical protein
MSDERRALAALQAAIVRALVEDDAPPPGFDPAELARARRVIAAKRRWVGRRRAGQAPARRRRWWRPCP